MGGDPQGGTVAMTSVADRVVSLDMVTSLLVVFLVIFTMATGERAAIRADPTRTDLSKGFATMPYSRELADMAAVAQLARPPAVELGELVVRRTGLVGPPPCRDVRPAPPGSSTRVTHGWRSAATVSTSTSANSRHMPSPPARPSARRG